MKRKNIAALFIAASMIITPVIPSFAAPVSNRAVQTGEEILEFEYENVDTKSITEENGWEPVTEEMMKEWARIPLGQEEPSLLEDSEIQRITDYGEGMEDIADAESENANLPASYDPSASFMPLRDQWYYGNCWSFSMTAAAEAYSVKHFGADPRKVNYSEMAMTYFGNKELPPDPLGNRKDNNYRPDGLWFNGNNTTYAYSMLAGWVGPFPESFAPFGGMPDLDIKDGKIVGFDTSVKVTALDGYMKQDALHLRNCYFINENDRDEIKKKILENGAVSASYYMTNAPQYENSEGGETYFYNDEMTTTNHAIAVIGWDDTISKDKFGKVIRAKKYNPETGEYDTYQKSVPNPPAGDGAWLIRNSWMTEREGTPTHNRNGYFWLSYYDTSFQTVKAYDFDGPDNYDNNYQYDGSFASSSFSQYDQAKFANRFTAKADENGEILKAISFLTRNTNVHYTVDIYLNPSERDPESGSKIPEATTRGISGLEGYYTIPLESPVMLENGDSYSVVVTFEKKGDTVKVPFEINSRENTPSHWYKNDVVCDAGESFWYDYDGNGWEDIALSGRKIISSYNYTPGNARIKAFTDNGKTPISHRKMIRYELGGGVNSSENPIYVEDVVAGKLLAEPTKAGSKFGGWYSDAGFENQILSLPADLTDDYTVYAKWIPNYRIRFDGNGATSGGMSPMEECEVGKDYILPANRFKRKGYTFVGWHLFPGPFVKPNPILDKNSFSVSRETEEVVLYAMWVKNGTRYHITYVNAETAKHSNPRLIKPNNKKITLKKASKKGYLFKGWYDDSGLTVPITTISDRINWDVKFYAKWEPITYSVDLCSNNGQNRVVSLANMKYGEYYTLPGNTFENGSKTFCGWSTSKKGKVKYTNGDTVRNLTSKNGKKVILYAVWK